MSVKTNPGSAPVTPATPQQPTATTTPSSTPPVTTSQPAINPAAVDEVTDPRARFTMRSPGGVQLFPGPPSYTARASSRVTTLGTSTIATMDEAAKKNLNGPEARLQNFTRGAMKSALNEIQADEARAAKLPVGSPERKAIEDKIDARVRMFENEMAMETMKTHDEIKKNKGAEGASGFKARLPPYLRECIDRGGVVVPGVPGAVVPRTDNGVTGGPTGLDYKIKF